MAHNSTRNPAGTRATVEEKLVQFFRSADGTWLGSAGDYYERDPADTAIVAMTALNDWAKKSHAFRVFLQKRGVI